MYFLDILIKNGILANQQGALVLVHEELWWQPRPSTCNDHEYQPALSGLYLHSVCVCVCVCVCTAGV